MGPICPAKSVLLRPKFPASPVSVRMGDGKAFGNTDFFMNHSLMQSIWINEASWHCLHWGYSTQSDVVLGHWKWLFMASPENFVHKVMMTGAAGGNHPIIGLHGLISYSVAKLVLDFALSQLGTVSTRKHPSTVSACFCTVWCVRLESSSSSTNIYPI